MTDHLLLRISVALAGAVGFILIAVVSFTIVVGFSWFAAGIAVLLGAEVGWKMWRDMR